MNGKIFESKCRSSPTEQGVGTEDRCYKLYRRTISVKEKKKGQKNQLTDGDDTLLNERTGVLT